MRAVHAQLTEEEQLINFQDHKLRELSTSQVFADGKDLLLIPQVVLDPILRVLSRNHNKFGSLTSIFIMLQQAYCVKENKAIHNVYSYAL